MGVQANLEAGHETTPCTTVRLLLSLRTGQKVMTVPTIMVDDDIPPCSRRDLTGAR